MGVQFRTVSYFPPSVEPISPLQWSLRRKFRIFPLIFYVAIGTIGIYSGVVWVRGTSIGTWTSGTGTVLEALVPHVAIGTIGTYSEV